MVIVDTSVWVYHFRQGSESLFNLLCNDQVLCHPLILLEIACGLPPAPRDKILTYIDKLQKCKNRNHFRDHELH